MPRRCFANDYLLTVLILILYFAYVGQAWNIMMGFAGQLSLGHALYVGLGAYVTAALFMHFGIGPWLGLLAAHCRSSMAVGAVIGFLAFRFGVAGVYFAILTIAFAEFARIGFDHFSLGRRLGRLVPAGQAIHRQRPVAAARLAGDVLLRHARGDGAGIRRAAISCLRSRIGYYWLAIREDEEAARATGIDTFRYKMYAVVISAGMTAFAGVFYAFYYNNLFPEQVFHISRSIELILGPIIGGIGTLFGPILGAFLLTGLSEVLQAVLAAFGIDVPGAKQVFYGICLLLVVVVAAGRRLAVAFAQARPARSRSHERRCSPSTASASAFAACVAVDDVSFEVAQGEIFAVIGPNGAGKTTLFNMIAGVFAPDDGTIAFAGERIDGLPPDEICRRGIGRTFQLVRPFPALTVEDNVMSARCCGAAHVERRARHAHEVLRRLDLYDKRAQPRLGADAAGPQAARGRARARHRSEAAAARRGDGGPAPDRDRPHGRDPARAQSRDRAHHPADRARHARGDGARRSACWCCITAPPSPKARPRRSCASRRWSNSYLGAEAVTDAARSKTSMSSTATRRRSTASRSRSAKARSSPSSAPTAPARPR